MAAWPIDRLSVTMSAFIVPAFIRSILSFMVMLLWLIDALLETLPAITVSPVAFVLSTLLRFSPPVKTSVPLLSTELYVAMSEAFVIRPAPSSTAICICVIVLSLVRVAPARTVVVPVPTMNVGALIVLSVSTSRASSFVILPLIRSRPPCK